MTNSELITDIYDNEFILIDRGNGEFTSMTKAHYEEMQAANVEKPTSKK